MDKITERHKLYFLILMVFIAGVIAYFRFLQPPAAVGKQNPMTDFSPPPTEMLGAAPGPMQLNGRDPAWRDTHRRSISRNIFEPVGPLPTTVLPKSAKTSHTAEVNMILSGTIIGDQSSIAIINNQFMRRGQKLGQYQIIRITPDKVHLASGDDTLVLNVISVTEAINE